MTLAERFWSKVERREPNDCWTWRASLDSSGYGQLKRDGKVVRASRLAYELALGPIPDGVFVCHKCDDRRCCNPSHLLLGANADNVADMVAKRRQALGEKSGGAKLTEAEVHEIVSLRRDGLTQSAIAARFGVLRQQISNILSGKSWSHLTRARKVA